MVEIGAGVGSGCLQNYLLVKPFTSSGACSALLQKVTSNTGRTRFISSKVVLNSIDWILLLGIIQENICTE